MELIKNEDDIEKISILGKNVKWLEEREKTKEKEIANNKDKIETIKKICEEMNTK